jgi:hypothetical protein
LYRPWWSLRVKLAAPKACLDSPAKVLVFLDLSSSGVLDAKGSKIPVVNSHYASKHIKPAVHPADGDKPEWIL